MTARSIAADSPSFGWLPRTDDAEVPRRSGRAALPLLLLATAAVLVALGVGANHLSFDIWGGLVVGPVLLAMTVPIARHIARVDDDPGVFRVIIGAAVLKLAVGTTVRYIVSFGVYGAADATRYHYAGALLAPDFRHGIFDGIGTLSGTRALDVLTGAVYAVTGPTKLGGFLVFSWLGFLGCVLFYRAFRIGYPAGDVRRYRLLVLFFPSLLYWPASIGKDAFMVFVLGGAVFGVAQLLVGRMRGIVWLGLSLWGASVVRPHIALIVLAGLAVAMPFRRSSTPRSATARRVLGSWGAKVVIVACLAVMSFLVVSRTADFFKLDSLDLDSATSVLERTQSRTSIGGSEFVPPEPTTVSGMAGAVITVIFRPFPFEASSGTALLAAGEGVALIVLAFVSIPRLTRLPLVALRSPYVAFAAGYVIAFCFAFASISNFGILARERVQLLPILFVLFAIAPPPPLDGPRPGTE